MEKKMGTEIKLKDFQYTVTQDLGHEVSFYMQSSKSEISINPVDKRLIVSAKVFGNKEEADNNRKFMPIILKIEGEAYFRFLAQFGELLFKFLSQEAYSTPFIPDFSEIVEVKDKEGNVIDSVRKMNLRSLSELETEEIPIVIELPN